MTQIHHIDSENTRWETISEGIERLILRSEPGENRILLRLGAGVGYPKHTHAHEGDEVFVLAGTYVDPDDNPDQEYGPGSYLYYPPGTNHYATSPTGCTFMVINAKGAGHKK